jgi:hypothetical protein
MEDSLVFARAPLLVILNLRPSGRLQSTGSRLKDWCEIEIAMAGRMYIVVLWAMTRYRIVW